MRLRMGRVPEVSVGGVALVAVRVLVPVLAALGAVCLVRLG
jgi:hypothetical protein